VVAGDITTFDLPLLLLYVASQFLSSMMMGTGDQMQRMLKYVMPVGIGVIMVIGRWPAGLFIYWFTSNMWTIGQQYLVKRTTKIPTQPAVAAISSEGESGTTEGRRAAGAKRRTTKRTDRVGRGPTSAARAGYRSH
jgi:YidC/Oxa1 family membrane protein insertase